MPETLAAIFDGTPRSLTLQSIPVPTPHADEILVRILGCTLCGSDIHTYSGRRSVAVPTILGHEIVGEIVEFGPHAPHGDASGETLAVGDRVTWAIVAGCRNCFYCNHDLWPKCERATKYGHEKLAPSRELLGGLAGYGLLVSGTAIYRLPAELPLEVVCPANCATATIAAAVEAVGEFHDATVLILGAGLLGLTATAMARVRGATKLLVVDVVESRRNRALHFGATHACSPGVLPERIRDLTSGRGIDVLIELTGSTDALAQATSLMRIGGRIVLVGAVFPGPDWQLSPEQIVRKQLSIRGVHNYSPRHLATAIEFLHHSHSRYPFAELVPVWYPLSQVQAAFECAEHGEFIRVGVHPD
jgi:putative phosphonate catabolism associated alcohol dehydrogenase